MVNRTFFIIYNTHTESIGETLFVTKGEADKNQKAVWEETHLVRVISNSAIEKLEEQHASATNTLDEISRLLKIRGNLGFDFLIKMRNVIKLREEKLSAKPVKALTFLTAILFLAGCRVMPKPDIIYVPTDKIVVQDKIVEKPVNVPEYVYRFLDTTRCPANLHTDSTFIVERDRLIPGKQIIVQVPYKDTSYIRPDTDLIKQITAIKNTEIADLKDQISKNSFLLKIALIGLLILACLVAVSTLVQYFKNKVS